MEETENKNQQNKLAMETVNELQYIEQIMVRKWMRIKTPEEIASLLEKPVKQIEEEIIHQAKKFRIKSLQQLQQEKQLRQINKDLAKKQRKALITSAMPKKTWKDQVKAFKPIDLSNKIAVRIDHRTVIYCNPGDDIETIKKKYKRISL